MMEFFRGRLFKSVIMFAMAFIFTVFGLSVFTSARLGSIFTGSAPWVLKVDGKKIDVNAFQETMQRQSERAQEMRQYGQDVDLVQMSENALIQRQILLQQAKIHGIVPENANDLAKAVEKDTHLAESFKPYGRAFKGAEAIRTFAEDQAIQGIYSAIQSLPIVTSAEIEADFVEQNTKAKLRFLEFPFAHYENAAQVADADAKAYYDAHKDLFWKGASVNIEFLKIDPITARALTTVSDEDVRKYYSDHKTDYQVDEVSARHILRKFPENATPDQEEQVRKKAQEVLDMVKKPGADFAALAREYSEDTGSAVSGGSLGWFGKGRMVKPFEDAAFALQNKGDLSGLVKTTYGFHILQLEDRRQGMKPFEEVAPEIRNNLALERADEKAREDAEELFFQVDAEGPEKAIADARFTSYGLIPQTTGFVTRNDTDIPNLGSSWQYGDVVDKALRARVGQWVEPIEVKQSYQNQIIAYVIIRPKERKPAGIADFETVKEDILKSLRQQKAQEMAQAAAARLWERHAPGDTLDALLRKYQPTEQDKRELTPRESGEFATSQSGYVASMGSCRPAMVAAFQMNPGEVRGPFLGQTAAYIVELMERKDPDMSLLTDAERANIRQRLLQTKQSDTFQVWYQNLRDAAKVERNEKTLAQF